MAGLMRSRASPRGYPRVHPSEDCKIRITGPLRIELTADTSITGIKRKQVIRKDLLKNQLVPKRAARVVPPSLHGCLAIITNNKRLQAKCTIETNRSHLSLRFGQKSTNLDSVTAPFRKIYLNDTPIDKIPLNLCQQRPGIPKVRESADLNP